MSKITKKADGKRKSTAALTVELQSDNSFVAEKIQAICDKAESLLENEAPSKRQRKVLVDAANSLLALHSSVEKKLPDLIPNGISRYSLQRLHAEKNYDVKNAIDCSAPRENLRSRSFEIGGITVPLPDNRKQYTAVEACSVLAIVEESKVKGVTLSSAVKAIDHLIPVRRSSMFCVYKKYKKNPNLEWPRMGRPSIQDNNSFLSSV